MRMGEERNKLGSCPVERCSISGVDTSGLG